MPATTLMKSIPHHEEKKFPISWWVYSLDMLLLLILLFAISISFSLANKMITVYTPLANAADEIVIEATTAHLWFEEIISGDRSESLEAVLGHLDQADWYAQAMLEGGSNFKGVFIPLPQAQLRLEINKVREKLAQFRKITQERWEFRDKSGIGTEIDQQYDALFRDFLAQANSVASTLQHTVQQDMRSFSSTTKILFSLCATLFLLTVTLFYRLEKRRAADFSAIQQATMQAKTSERWLKTTIRSLGDGLIICDIHGTVTYLNPVAVHLTGWSPEEAVGERIEKVFNIVNEFTRMPVENPVSQVIKKKFVVGLANHTLLLAKNGNEYPISDSGAPIIDDNDNLLGVVMVFQDVTKRRETEKALLQSKEQWESSFNAIEEIMTLQTPDMRIIRANSATERLFKLKQRDLIGRHCYELFLGSNTQCPGCPQPQTLSEKTTHSHIIEHPHLKKFFHVSTAPVLSEKGDISFLVHIARDITKEMRLEEELFQARKMEAIGTLAGGIAHDFNNILTAILGYAELIRLDIAAGTKTAANLDEVITGAHRATNLVKQILTFSRKDRHKLEPLEPHLIMREALKLMRASLPTSISIKEDIDKNSGKILADPTKLHQVIVNLCTNALHAMENEKGTLTVSLHRKDIGEEDLRSEPGVSPGFFLELAVSDTGTGIEKAILDRIFEPYFTTKEPEKGTGMGLAVVHGIVQNYGGFINVDSESGKGSCFRIYFPALQEEEQEDSLQFKSPHEHEIPGGTEHILVIDDESMIVRMQKSTLERLGYQVTMADNSLEALNLFKSAPSSFDLVITDQTMPILTGADLARAMLEIRPDLPIILCTGYSSMISEEKAMKIGIKKFVFKPVDRKKMAIMVRETLDGP